MQTDELISFIESGGSCRGREKKKKLKKKNRAKDKRKEREKDVKERQETSSSWGAQTRENATAKSKK